MINASPLDVSFKTEGKIDPGGNSSKVQYAGVMATGLIKLKLLSIKNL
jgi:hypothetical protein